MESDVSLHCSQEPGSGLYPQANESSPQFPTYFYFSNIHYKIIIPSTLGLASNLLFSGFPTKLLYTFLLFPMIFPHHSSRFGYLCVTLWSVLVMKLPLCSILQPPAPSPTLV